MNTQPLTNEAGDLNRQQAQGLNWSLAIATYARADMLCDCITLALRQSRPPAEEVVVDASEDWAQTAQRARSIVQTIAPSTALRYEQSDNKSSAAQRNRCVELSTSEVLFLIDDDSLLLPGAAEEVMKIYELDVQHAIAGVALVEVSQDPRRGEDEQSFPATSPSRPKNNPFVKLLRGIIKADDLFVPYDEHFPSHPIPEAVRSRHVAPRALMAGKQMTVRRAVALEEPFCGLLSRVSAGEDSDMSYRVSRHGALVTAGDAFLHHVGSTGGRVSVFASTALGMLNPLVHHRLHSTDLDRSLRANRALIRRRLIIECLKDLRDRSPSLPRARGVWFALSNMKRILHMDPDRLQAWYPTFQKQVIEGKPNVPSDNDHNTIEQRGEAR